MLKDNHKDLDLNKGFVHIAQSQRFIVNPEQRIVAKIFGIMSIDMPEYINSGNLKINTVVDILNNRIQVEEVNLATMFDECTSAVTYDEIESKKSTITERKDFYTNISTSYQELYTEMYQQDNTPLACPTDQTLLFINKSISVTNNTEALVWINPITTFPELLKALTCKFNFLAEICDRLIEIRNELSNDSEQCNKALIHFFEEKYYIIQIAAKKNIYSIGLKTPKQKDKYQNEIKTRIKKGILSCQIENYYFNMPSFAHYIANTPGICLSLLYDFAIDIELLKQLDDHILSYPWLKNDYYNLRHKVLNMIKDAYDILTCSNIKIPPTIAYAHIWSWLRDSLGIVEDKARNAIPMYTSKMNQLTGNAFSSAVIHNAKSDDKQVNTDQLNIILGGLVYKHGLKSPQMLK